MPGGGPILDREEAGREHVRVARVQPHAGRAAGDRARADGHVEIVHVRGKRGDYQDDEFGLDGIKGLGYAIPASQVVAKEPYNVAASNPAAEVGTLTAAIKASKAQVVIAFAVPAFMALLRLSELSLNYSPQLVSSDVGSDPITLSGLLNSFAMKTGNFGAQLIQGIITDSYLPSLGSNDSWI